MTRKVTRNGRGQQQLGLVTETSVAGFFENVFGPHLVRLGRIQVTGTMTSWRPHKGGWVTIEIVTMNQTGDVVAKLAVSLAPQVRRSITRPEVGAEISVTGVLETHPMFSPLKLRAERIAVTQDVGETRQQLVEHLQGLAATGAARANKNLATPTRIRIVGIVGPASGGAGQHDPAVILGTETDQGSVVGGGVVVRNFPTRMMGPDAGVRIAAAITRAGVCCDVVLVCRGGGAAADLAGFNTQQVVDAIVSARVPVITGIGHATDTTAADLVAHTCTATPTAAAQWVKQVRERSAREQQKHELVVQQRQAAQELARASMVREEAARVEQQAQVRIRHSNRVAVRALALSVVVLLVLLLVLLI